LPPELSFVPTLWLEHDDIPPEGVHVKSLYAFEKRFGMAIARGAFPEFWPPMGILVRRDPCPAGTPPWPAGPDRNTWADA